MVGLLVGLLNVLAPPICPKCFENVIVDNSGVCKECFHNFEKITIACKICGIPLEKTFGNAKADFTSKTCGDCLLNKKFFKASRSAVEYNGFIKEAVTAFKYHNGFHLKPVLSNLICQSAKAIEDEEFVKFDIVVPVPLHRARLKSRGYNQSLELAKVVSKRLSIDLSIDSLVRLKDTTPQVGLKPKQRMINVKGAFGLNNREFLKDKVVLLIDDVYTTGATINECAKVLTEVSGDVYGLTISRTVVEN